MTNELEKTFFDTFGIEPKCQNKFINPSKCPFIESRECCDCVSYEYPPFTAEKQLELIKWVSNFKVYESVIHKDRKWFMCASIGYNDYCESRDESFEQALASLILELWKELTDDQKQEIKRILQ